VYQGEISYSIYMWHLVVWIFLRRGLGVVLHVQVIPRLWLIALGLLLTLAVSSLSYHFVEGQVVKRYENCAGCVGRRRSALSYNLLITDVSSSYGRGLQENVLLFCHYCGEAALPPHAKVR
jgi:peptidoglycan/LPS O-acetylase OafA/YrhL